ncbi:hypothetical protein LTR27_008621 [Elasticomyces elasticus]|nr:hypothetical protein LTR27_008621 [Elasticomyces elasticus]
MGRAIKPSGGGRQSAPAMGVQMAKMKKDALKSGQIPLDVGLMQDTLVMPTGKNLPSWTRDWRARMRLERRRLRLRAVEYFSVMIYKYWMVKPRPDLALFRISSLARDLHRDTYSHFASGNLQPMESKLCESFLASLRRRISQRAPNTGLKWTVHKYLSKPKCMSYKAAYYPPQKGELKTERNGILQAVVRLHSLQSLQHFKKITVRDGHQKLVVKEVATDAQGNEVLEVAEGVVPKDAKESVEYLVVQKSLRMGKESPWMVWGTTEETKVKDLRKDKRSMRQMFRGDTRSVA